MDLISLSLLSLLSAAPANAAEPLCLHRAPCSLTEKFDAGKDAQGHSLQIKQLSLGWLRDDTRKSADSMFEGPRDEEEGPESNGSAKEWWLVRSGSPPQLLLASLEGGHDSGDRGELEVKVGNNRFTLSLGLGAVRKGTSSTTIQLSPLALLSSSDTYYPTGRQVSGRTWEGLKLKGSSYVPLPDCGEGGTEYTPAPGTYAEDSLTVPLLPRLDQDPAWLQEGWKTTALGSCALEAEFFVLGKAGSPKNAALKALLVSADTLVLEVRDDHWTGPSGKWLADDHVELWLDSTEPSELNQCTPPTPEQQPMQWGLRIADGQVFPAYGSPKKNPQVDKVELREAGALVGYRLKVVLPQPFKGISVLYSDSDSGKKQERLVGTSAVKYPRPETLNAVQQVNPQQATCEVRDGALSVKLTPLKVSNPRTAVLAP